MITKKVLFALFLTVFLGISQAASPQEEKFNACVHKYRNIPEAMKQWVLENKITVDIPEDARHLITKEIKYLIIPNPKRPEQMDVYASLSPAEALQTKVLQCMNEVNI